MSEYIRDFNREIQGNSGYLSEDTIRYLGIIASNDEYLNVDSVQIPSFFINLYDLIKKQTRNNTVIHHCLTILENGMKNTKLKSILINNYRFVPVIAELLFNHPEENPRILGLLEEMTYGIHFNRHEYYLDAFINHLIGIIRQQTPDSEVAFTILINLSFKNPECMALVMRSINLKDLAVLVKNYGIFTCKFYMIFGMTDTVMVQNEVRYCLKEIETTLNEYNYAKLKHVVDYIVEVKKLASSIEFDTGIKAKIVETIRVITESDATSDETNRQQKLNCMPLIFRLLEQMLNKNDSDAEILTSVVRLSLHWLPISETTINSMKVLSRLFEHNSLEFDEQLLNLFEMPMTTIIQKLANKNLSITEMITFIQLVIQMIKLENTRNLVVKLMDPGLFETILVHISTVINDGTHNIEISSYLELFVHVLYALYELMNVNAQYYAKFSDLMQDQKFQILLAKSFNAQFQDAKIYEILFRMNRTSEFPVEEVSSILARQKFVCMGSELKTDIVKIVVTPSTSDLEEKLDQTLQKLSSYPNNDILVTEIIQAYELNINSYKSREEDYKQRLKEADMTINRLSHENEKLQVQVTKFNLDNFERILNFEAISNENNIMKNELKTLRLSVQQFNQSYEAEKKSNTENKEILRETKEKLLTVLDEYERAKARLKEVETIKAELEAENKKRIEEFKRIYKAHETKVKESQKELEEKRKEFDKLCKTSKEQSDFLKCLEKQIIVKDEQIKTLKEELAESDQLRSSIANMLTKRQKK
uniref:CSON007855 protein n=1 Tax=Culicoides sonorensis TaxID=179676 RepID=A0A336LXY9_CULSO